MRPAPGFTLIELMIALVVGAVAVIAALEIYARGRDIYRVNERVARLQEQGRVAFATIEPDVELAGYYGFTRQPDAIRFVRGANPDVPIATADRLRQFPFHAGAPMPLPVPGLPAGAHACGVNFAVDVATPVQGSNEEFALGRSPTAACNPYQGRAQSGADTLTLRRVETQPGTAEANRVQIYASRHTSRSSQLMFADGNAPGVIDEHHRVHNLVVRVYYVASDSVGQRNFPALRVKSLTRSGTNVIFDEDEVMPGVEDLQVQFGIAAGGASSDAAGSAASTFGATGGRVARYVDPGSPDLRWAQVVCVRVWLRIRADVPEPTFVDARTYRYANVVFTPSGAERNYRRVLITRTTTLRNARAT